MLDRRKGSRGRIVYSSKGGFGVAVRVLGA